MSPQESFDHQIMLFSAITVAHQARCLDKAGLLDSDAKKSLRGQFKLLSQSATELGHPQVLAWLDILQGTLPPLPSE